MRGLVLASCLAFAAAACESRPDGRSPLPQPTPVSVPPAPPPEPPPPPTAPPAGFRLIQLGEKVNDSIVEEERRYAVAAPTAGHVIARLEWASDTGAVTLRLEVNGREIDWRCTPDAPWPVEGRVEVKAGEHVRIVVRRGPGCWDYRVASLATEPFAFSVWAELAE